MTLRALGIRNFHYCEKKGLLHKIDVFDVRRWRKYFPRPLLHNRFRFILWNPRGRSGFRDENKLDRAVRPVHIYTTFGTDQVCTDGVEANIDNANLDLERRHIITTYVFLIALLCGPRNMDLALLNVFPQESFG